MSFLNLLVGSFCAGTAVWSIMSGNKLAALVNTAAFIINVSLYFKRVQ